MFEGSALIPLPGI